MANGSAEDDTTEARTETRTEYRIVGDVAGVSRIRDGIDRWGWAETAAQAMRNSGVRNVRVLSRTVTTTRTETPWEALFADAACSAGGDGPNCKCPPCYYSDDEPFTGTLTGAAAGPRAGDTAPATEPYDGRPPHPNDAERPEWFGTLALYADGKKTSVTVLRPAVKHALQALEGKNKDG